MSRINEAEELLTEHMLELGLNVEREFSFHPTRKWRFDLACGSSGIELIKLACEVEGGMWVKGAHNRGKHFQSDMDKYNEASILGWSVLRFSTKDVMTGKAKEIVERWLQARATGPESRFPTWQAQK